ncbi:MAG TPA: UvrD-helicase domain-containing protein [Candidatus Binatia bacterium]|nr:UvrD-helicase domain-containing protein [Candidatus Binatia bacterium]
MTTSAKHLSLPDARDREIAVGTFDRNLVVTAGAGTGKTTLLVDRLIHLVLRNPDPLKITEIVALTFTNKAADEMKLRLRQRLQSYLAIDLDHQPATDAEENTAEEVRLLIKLYQLSKDEIDRRIHDALRHMERSDIGTIHSFAATLLRLYPLEAGVDPQFHEDEGAEFDRLFDEEWDLWLDQELALDSLHAEDWRNILARCQLDHIKALAKSLSAETVDLRQDSDGAKPIPAPLRAWLDSLEAKASALLERHPEDRTNEKLVRAAIAVLGTFKRTGRCEESLTDECALLAAKSINRDLRGWSATDVHEAQALVRAAKGMAGVDNELADRLWRLLIPYAEMFRERFIREGHISFDGLLVRARNLVRDQHGVRAELKRRYRSILIDEFQDTDPIQYEILLYLAEPPDRSASDWRQVKLLPGKIFVVGDPKQSIYAFRRADIEAYLEVVEKIIKAQDGVECLLTTNFRSNGVILNAVNGIFDSLIKTQPGVQPFYIAIHPAPGRTAAPSQIPNVLIRKVIAEDRAVNAETARRLEGESLARWLKQNVLGQIAIQSARGETVYAQPKDVAILLRKLTDIHDYLEPLRRQGIRYVVEGERHFYAAKEIIDAVNLLRAVASPYDRLALVGVLRSPLGGLTDRQIYQLHRENLLDYQAATKLGAKDYPAALGPLYDALARLHEETRRMSIGAAVAHVFSILPVELLAACHFHGEQAVANLAKLSEQAERLGRESSMTLKEAIRQLECRVLDVTEEGESVLAEENLDAVRLMSIHKAKGLEFPIVVLAGCHSGTEARQSGEPNALFDWSTGLTGLRIGAMTDLTGLFITEKTRLRNIEEQKRLLYVAMTRAREHLIVSYAESGRPSSGSFIAMLDDTLDGAVTGAEKSMTVPLGNSAVKIEIVSENLTAPGRTKDKLKRAKKKPDWQPYIDLWAHRAAVFEKSQQTTPFLTPTLLKRQEQTTTETGAGADGRGARQTAALVIGDLAHRFLQGWRFSADVNGFEAELREFIGAALPREFHSNRGEIEADLREIFRCFFGSKVYRELATAAILGREVPLLMPWNGQIMEGVIDLLYEKNGLLYLADYKTDRIDRRELAPSAAEYRQQAEIYMTAARQCLRRDITAFKLIFLRLGDAVELMGDKSIEPTLF